MLIQIVQVIVLKRSHCSAVHLIDHAEVHKIGAHVDEVLAVAGGAVGQSDAMQVGKIRFLAVFHHAEVIDELPGLFHW